MRISSAHITSSNINQEGLNTEKDTTTSSFSNTIRPDYNTIATGAAITGFVAGAMVTLGNWLGNKFGSNGEGVKDPNAYYKPQPGSAAADANPNFTGVNKPGALNMGSANLTVDPNMVSQPVMANGGYDTLGNWINKPSWNNEGSWFMKPIETSLDGMHNLALFHDVWGEPNNLMGHILGAPGINQLTIFVPGIPLSYCTMYPGICTGVVTDNWNKPNTGQYKPPIMPNPKNMIEKNDK